MWQFALLLIAAMVASLLLSLWQHNRYLAVVNAMARANAGRNVRLVSGRAKGRLRGAVVVLLVDPSAREIVDARAMEGASIFARLTPAPELLGPVATTVDRAGTKHLKKAVESALAMVSSNALAEAAKSTQLPGTRIRIPRTQTSPS
jgi:DNA-binding transcriptional regulator of glucitol operon